MDYTTLITSQHRDKPKFSAMVAAAIEPLADVGAFLSDLPASFDIDTAEGAQLDVVGEWVGLSRIVNMQITGVYFSFDTEGLGFDEGYIRGQFDPVEGPNRMDDRTFRAMLYAKIGANHWDGSLSGLDEIMVKVFAGYDCEMFIDDQQDMTIGFYLVGSLPPPIIVALIKGGYLSVKPSGVLITGYFSPSYNTAPFFGFDVQNKYISGFDYGVFPVPLGEGVVFPGTYLLEDTELLETTELLDNP